MDKIRVLAMLEARSLSGSAKAVLEFANEAALVHQSLPKIDLSILTFDRGQGESPLTEKIRKSGIPLHVVSERGRFDLNVIPQLHAAVTATSADIIWSNSVKSHFLVRYSGLNKSKKWVAFHHGYTTTDLKMRVYNQLDRWSLRKAHKVFTSSASFIEELVRNNVPAQRIHVQHMPIRPFVPVSDDDKSALLQRLGITAGTRVLLSVGRLSLEKGHADLIRAFARMMELSTGMSLRLIIVGEGPERSRMETISRNLNLSGVVTLTGQQDDTDPYYAIADVFVLPSHSEGCPNVLLEAMAAGAPVVATAVGGVPEVVTNGHDAILVEKQDLAGMASATVQLLNDQQLRDRLVSNARRIVLRKSPEAYFKSLASVFSQVCANAE
jgi:glycosyltransferase involved in cell wall biosynthesis